ncbi:hypothetical protein AWB81_05429 [Caballeronia arationis]|jgi:hypothetical protein|uniref:Uncharacterized protein n=1 Tax=Caballeronia arationis TaxID=1777142 RepID=A0A7Z7ID88_9BURK|nr:hypothetical protein [Caballeronia arationis]SAK96851.1 hypothetical protein AWB81_05429 [Caballeronia arationis]SOE82351.1 hypothetical protein SAMN05446927_5673 [Caballeronia arationis]
MPTASTTQPAGQPARPNQPPPAATPKASPNTEVDKPDADKAEPDPHERPPVRSDDN